MSNNENLGNVELSLKQYKRILNNFEIVIRKLEITYNDKE
jgi:plasmid rolling circle replication initiator protein Rep